MEGRKNILLLNMLTITCYKSTCLQKSELPIQKAINNAHMVKEK